MTAPIIVPFTRVHPRTRAALEPYGDRVEYHEMKGEFDYWYLVTELWRAGEDFTVVEHDIEVLPGAIEELDACPEPWCSYSYPYRKEDCDVRNLAAFGCVRFRAELLVREPQVGQAGRMFRRASAGTRSFLKMFPFVGRDPFPWAVVDSQVGLVLDDRQVPRHFHGTGRVLHHRAFSDIGCLCGEECGTEPDDAYTQPERWLSIEKVVNDLAVRAGL